MERAEAQQLLAEERTRLEQLRTSIQIEAAGLTEDSTTNELSSADQHPADTATETFEREKDLSILERIESQLADVARAEKRLASGSYGTCEACGRAIDDDRLRARPATRFCLDDQHLAERAIA
jgi:RNA polymerase-binding transcription factor DksA